MVRPVVFRFHNRGYSMQIKMAQKKLTLKSAQPKELNLIRGFIIPHRPAIVIQGLPCLSFSPRRRLPPPPVGHQYAHLMTNSRA